MFFSLTLLETETVSVVTQVVNQSRKVKDYVFVLNLLDQFTFFFSTGKPTAASIAYAGDKRFTCRMEAKQHRLHLATTKNSMTRQGYIFKMTLTFL